VKECRCGLDWKWRWGAAAISAGSPAKEFAAALRALYHAAGLPPYAGLVYQGHRQHPPVKIAAQSLSAGGSASWTDTSS
jgi:hypothetical protein